MCGGFFAWKREPRNKCPHRPLLSFSSPESASVPVGPNTAETKYRALEHEIHKDQYPLHGMEWVGIEEESRGANRRNYPTHPGLLGS